ncbi:MAG: TA0938 family protein [Thermoplasmata archaeon]
MKHNYEGCAICDSTWGDVWAEVEGERTFFCCEVCAVQFQGLVDRVKAETGWTRIDQLTLAGDRRGRTGEAMVSGERFHFFIAFNPEGAIREFARREAPAP